VIAMTRRILALWFLAATAMIGVAPGQAADPPKLAIQGFDPVAYFTEQRPVEGKPELTHVWDGLRYQFSSAANRDRFVADPDRYAPNFAGHCAVTLAVHKMLVPADPKYWLIVDGKLYLFAGPQGPERVQMDPSLIKKANAQWSATRKPN
jgi:hypothetical protein